MPDKAGLPPPREASSPAFRRRYFGPFNRARRGLRAAEERRDRPTDAGLRDSRTLAGSARGRDRRTTVRSAGRAAETYGTRPTESDSSGDLDEFERRRRVDADPRVGGRAASPRRGTHRLSVRVGREEREDSVRI